jgi:nucleolin
MSKTMKKESLSRRPAIEEDDDSGSDSDNGDVDTHNRETNEGSTSEAAKRKRKRKRKGSEKTSGVGSAQDTADEGSKVQKVEVAVPENAKRFNNTRTIYVEGLPFSARESDIRSFFESCGTIVSIRLPTWHDSGRLRGYGHIEFTDDEAAAAAFDLDGCDFRDSGRYLKIQRPMTPRLFQNDNPEEKAKAKPVGCRCVFVKNLPYEVTEDEIIEAVKVCGPILKVRLAVWGHTNTLKGFGYIDFKREDSAEIAVKKSGQLSVKGRPLVIDYETGAPKGSFRDKK